MKQDFKIPQWFLVPQAVFDASQSGIGAQYLRLTFSSQISGEPTIEVWVQGNKILSDKEAERIKYVESDDISGGYYEIDGKWIPWSGQYYEKVACMSGGETEWKVTCGTGACGNRLKVIEKNGVIISRQKMGMYIA